MARLATLNLIAALLGLTVASIAAQDAQAADKASYPSFGKIVRHDPRFDKIVPKDAHMEQLGGGLIWCEGPTWIKEGGYVLFSDIPRNSVMKWKEGEGLSLFMRPAGFTGVVHYGREPGSNGLLTDPQGRVVFCEHGDRRISRLEPNGGKKTLVDSYQGKRLNSPNDAVYNSKGDLYFTDPPYGLPENFDDPRRELDFCGVYRLSKDGQLTLLTKDMTRPNGIALSPDEKTLYVAQSDPEAAHWMAFEVKSDGTLGKGRKFYDATAWAKEGRKGLPDGMDVDEAGNVFATGPGGVHVFAPDGTLLGTLDTNEPTGNVCWGDDGRTLYVCANTFLVRIRLNTKGLRF
jgi:gluconolactonase